MKQTFAAVTIALATALGGACSELASTSYEQLEVGSCETWTVDDPITIWPPDHEIRRYSLDDCVTIAQTECPPPSSYVCGDGVLDPGEECDDGNGNPYDGCDICRLVDITPDVAQPGQSAAAGLSITSITSSEPDDETGDGSTIGDTVVVDATTFELRAERSGVGNGRTYRVNFVDAEGETGACTFFVPHDLGQTY